MKSLSAFRRDRKGNFAIFSAILAVPLVVSAGVMLDFGTITRKRAELQHAMDAAALAIAREGPALSDVRANEIAKSYVAGNFDAAVDTLKVDRTANSVRVSAATTTSMSFAGLIGYSNYRVDASAVADITLNNFEIALVLESANSMNGTKLTSLKGALIGFLDMVALDPRAVDKIKVAMVPYATFVNVGPEHGPRFDKKGKAMKGSGATWLDVEGKANVPQLEMEKGISRFEVFNNLKQPWRGCVETRHPTAKTAYDTTDAPAIGKGSSPFVPALAIDEPDFGYLNSYISSSVDPLDKSLVARGKKLKKYGVPNGLIAGALGTSGNTDDDDEDDDDDNSGQGNSNGQDPYAQYGTEWDPVAVSANGGRGPNFGCTAQPLTPLSKDFEALKAKAGALTAAGNANIMEGAAWGWRVLSPGAPFSEGAAFGATTKKIMVLLADGSNEIGTNTTALGSTYSSVGFAVEQRLEAPKASGKIGPNEILNLKTIETCKQAKAAGVEIYTIRLEDQNKATAAMLLDCASSAKHFFDVPSASQLGEVFNQIAGKLGRVRISS